MYNVHILKKKERKIQMKIFILTILKNDVVHNEVLKDPQKGIERLEEISRTAKDIYKGDIKIEEYSNKLVITVNHEPVIKAYITENRV